MSKRYHPGGDPANRMFATARELLWRQRQIHKFPVDKDELLLSMLPPEAQDYVLTFEGTYQWQNLTRCISLTTSCAVELKGEVGVAFWMRWGPRNLRPSPINSSGAFELSPDNLHYKAVVKWHDGAREMHERLTLCEHMVHKMLMKADHPVLVRDYWPDLHKFVVFKPPRGQESPESKRRRNVPMPSVKDKALIIETLAGSTLLPKYTPDVWVGYDVEE